MIDAIHIRTPDVMCDGSASAIRRSLAGLPGIRSVTTGASGTRASVRFDDGRVDRSTLVAALRLSGFDADEE